MPSFAANNSNVWDAIAQASPNYDPKLFQLGKHLKDLSSNKAEMWVNDAGIGAFSTAMTGATRGDALVAAAEKEANAKRSTAMWGAGADALSGVLGGFGKMDFGGGDSGGISFSDAMDLGLPSYGDYGGIPLEGFGAFG